MAKRTKTKPRPPQSAVKSTVKPAPKPTYKPTQAARILRVKKPFDWLALAGAAFIAAVVFWIYWPALNGTWLWDDDYLIQKSDIVHDSDGLWNIWFTPGSLVDYYPITVSLEWLEWEFWPNQPLCYHLTNVILHIGNALLVWHLFRKLGLRLAWLGGLFFAIHPAMVESVAWMAEMKNTLSMLPFLLALCTWIDFDRYRNIERYLLTFGLFLVAMLCKPTMLMFPVLILLYAWWKHDRITWRDLALSLPFFAISAAMTLLVIIFAPHGVGEETIPLGGVLSRLACAGTSLVFYFSRCFLPILLLPIYPQWQINPPQPWQFAPWLLFFIAMHWLWTKHTAWARSVLFGLGYFLINLVPFVGFHAISFMRFAWTMDHFLYLPILGLLALAVAAMGDIERKLSSTNRRYALAGVTLVAVIFTVGSHEYAKTFASSEAQWSYTIQRYPNAWPAHNNLGNAYSDAGRTINAGNQYLQALAINPGYPEAHNNLGIIYARLGHADAAVAEFQLALKYCPDLQSAQENLARVQEWQRTHPAAK